LAIESEELKGEDVVRVLNRLKTTRGVPKMVHGDNGSEFCSQAMDLWAYRHAVRRRFRRTENRQIMLSWSLLTEHSDRNA
jgi:putative transposase